MDEKNIYNGSSAAEAQSSSKLTEEEYLQRKFDEATSPRAAEYNPTMIAAEAQSSSKLTEEEYLQRMIDEATSPRAAEYNPTVGAVNPDEVIHRSR